MKTTMMDVPLSTNMLLDRASRYFGDRGVIGRLADKTIYRRSYSEICQRSRQLAQALVRAGVLRGEAVATLGWNHAWHLECYLGIPAAGAVLHTLNHRLSPEDLAYIIDNAEDRFLVIDDINLSVWDRVRPLLSREVKLIVVPYGGIPVPEYAIGYEQFISCEASAYTYPLQSENEAVGMCYTSGTTGRPKGVVYSHRSMMLHAITICMPDVLNLSYRDRILMITPMFHANAWSVPFSALMVGADQVMPGHHMGAADLLDLIEQAQTTMALAVPTIWTGVLQALEGPLAGREIVLKGMRVLVGGLAPAPSMIKKFEAYGVSVMQGYGMTETSPTGSFSHSKPEHDSLPLDQRIAIRAMQGMAPPFVDMRIVDDFGNSVPWDGSSPGEVQLHGPWISGDYHRTSRDPEKFTRDGWLRTGDLGTINADGYLRIVDRAKDIIKSGGEWISSADLESLVVSHPDILEVAVIAVHHPRWDERPLVIAVRRPGSSLDFVALREFLRPNLARFQIPDDFEWVESLPKSGTGKIQKMELRQQFKDRLSVTP